LASAQVNEVGESSNHFPVDWSISTCDAVQSGGNVPTFSKETAISLEGYYQSSRLP